MNRAKFIIYIFCLLILVSCKSKKVVSNNDGVSVTTNEKSDNVRLIVSFISKGKGTDFSKRTEFLSYVESHSKRLACVAIKWGREGETDYCLMLKELTEKEQIDFVNAVKKIASETNLMVISENTVCAHKSR